MEAISTTSFKVLSPIIKLAPPLYKFLAKKFNPVNYKAISFDYDSPGLRGVNSGQPKFGINITVKNNSGYSLFIDSFLIELKNSQIGLFELFSKEWADINNGEEKRFCFERPIMTSELNSVKEIFDQNSSKWFSVGITLFVDSYFGKAKFIYNLKISLDQMY